MAFLSSILHPLETRIAFAATWNVTVNDPGNLYSTYHAKLISFVQAAGNDWAKLLTPVNTSIAVQVNLVNNISTAAAASATVVQVGTNGGLNVFEQGVAYELRTGNDPNGASPDAILNINGQYMVDELYFDPGVNPASRLGVVPGNKTDAYSTILHELGHVLAWNGFRDYLTGTLPGNDQSTFDQFVTTVIDNPFFNGTRAAEVYGDLVPLTYGNLYHVANEEPRPGTELLTQLMNGVAFGFGAKYDFSPLDIAVIQDVGLPTLAVSPTAMQTFDYLSKPSVSWSFSAPVRWELSLDDITLTLRDSNAVVPSSSLSLVYDRGTDIAKLTYTPGNGVLPDGNYRVVLSSNALRDLLQNQLDQTYTLDFFVFAGDANHDRLIDTADFNPLAGNFGSPGANFSEGDFNYDGAVDSADFNLLAAKFGQRLAVPAVPIIAGEALFSPAVDSGGGFSSEFSEDTGSDV